MATIGLRNGLLTIAAALLVAASSASAQRVGNGGSLELDRGDHIALIGSGLAERMQHHGWLETLIHERFAEHELVFRNLGFTGDSVTVRQRSEGFGSPDEWLTRVRADVVFAFFGFAESFEGEAGLEQFRTDLHQFVEHTRSQQYNGEGPPRLVLFSPIAHENLDDPNLPDGRQRNADLVRYTQVIAEVAEATDVKFVDLFTPTLEGYGRTARRWTINGVHLNEDGSRELAKIADTSLFGGREYSDLTRLTPLRDAVLDKSWHWFQRYRVTDGYSVYGGRSHLEFVEGQTNREVMMRELEVLDVLTANRDERIWAVAQGDEHEVDDSNTPPFIDVQTNQPGENDDGSHVFRGGEEAIETMQSGPGLQVNLFASEEQFEELANPVQMQFDTAGRLWVATWPTYPHWQPKSDRSDKLIILEDTDGDGRADRRTVFADGLHNPTGFEFHDGGVIVACAPDLWFLKDTTGDGKADHRERILGGLDSADTHHAANSFVYDPGGGLHFGEGLFHRTQIETPYGVHRNVDAAIWRFEPRTWKVERRVPYGFANPHGHVFDKWGQDIIHDGTGSQPYLGSVISAYLPAPLKHPPAPQVYQQRTRPTSATAILSSEHFPEEHQGDLLVANVIGFRGILRYRLEEDGAGIAGHEEDFLVQASDPNFRPVDVKVGPDGAVYFADWQNPIIGHMQHNLRDPSRDKQHGRIYRITHKERPLAEPVAIADEPTERLVALLASDIDGVRYRAKIELGGRETEQVLAAVDDWVEGLDEDDPQHEHRLMEALWVHQWHNVVNEPLLRRMLNSPQPLARAAATRVLTHWRGRVDGTLSLLRELAEDPHPRVRLEAVRACSFIREPEAVDVALLATRHEQDRHLEYVFTQTMRSLEPVWQQALRNGVTLAEGNEAGVAYLLGRVTAEELLQLPASEQVHQAILTREDTDRSDRRDAVRALAESRGQSEVAVLVDVLRDLDEDGGTSEAVAADLGRLIIARRTSELAEDLPLLKELAETARQSLTRQWAYAAWASADRGFEGVWEQASQSVPTLRDAVLAVQRVGNRRLRASAYELVRPLLDGLPEPLAEAEADEAGTYGRYVRIELPRTGALTLAEVQVLSDGASIAPGGEASQSSTDFGGDADRAIDGNTSGVYSDGGQTHTQEQEQPWWELDLGEPRPIESIVIWNRSENDGEYADRLDGFTLKVLDGDRETVFSREAIAAPATQQRYTMPGRPADVVREAAIGALVATGEQPEQTFAALADLFAEQPALRPAVVEALSDLPRDAWAAEPAGVIVRAMIEHIEAMPVSARTTESAMAMQRLGHDLAQQLPEDEAASLAEQLGSLGVTIITIKPVNHQMLYDTISFVVEAGKPVELIFDNTDEMPHNLLIVEPGSMEEVSLAAEAMAAEPDAFARGFVPDMDQVLWATGLLNQGEGETLSFTAPQQAGEYPYVCTFPGHWRRMYGVMIVVDDLAAYEADPVEPTDPLTSGELKRAALLENPAEAAPPQPQHDH